jgi:uncharacterized Tic20 family protein
MVNFAYVPGEHEKEKASNSYLMSLVAVIAGLPFPIINLIATLFFYVGNRKSTYFVRWHCTQALLSQLMLFCINVTGVWWTLFILFGSLSLSSTYIAYIFTVILFNILDFIGTIYAAVQTRNGVHVMWWFFGELTNLICKNHE